MLHWYSQTVQFSDITLSPPLIVLGDHTTTDCWWGLNLTEEMKFLWKWKNFEGKVWNTLSYLSKIQYLKFEDCVFISEDCPLGWGGSSIILVSQIENATSLRTIFFRFCTYCFPVQASWVHGSDILCIFNINNILHNILYKYYMIVRYFFHNHKLYVLVALLYGL